MGFFGSILGGILGGANSIKGGRDNEKLIQGLRSDDKEFNERMYNQNLLNNRANQYNDWGSLTWGKDAEGRPVQMNMLNPAEASRLQDFRQIAANRMQQAGNVDLSQMSKPINYAAFPSVASQNWKPSNANYDPFAAIRNQKPGPQPQAPANPYTNMPAAGQGSLGGAVLNAPIINPEVVAQQQQMAPQAPAAVASPTAPPPPDYLAQMEEMRRQLEFLQQQQQQQQSSWASMSAGA